MRFLLHLIIIILLTIITQVGGAIYLISVLLINKTSQNTKLKRSAIFSIFYLTATFIVIPNIAPLIGREKISETKTLKAHSFFYKLANRNYVRPELNKTLLKVASHKGSILFLISKISVVHGLGVKVIPEKE